MLVRLLQGKLQGPWALPVANPLRFAFTRGSMPIRRASRLASLSTAVCDPEGSCITVFGKEEKNADDRYGCDKPILNREQPGEGMTSWRCRESCVLERTSSRWLRVRSKISPRKKLCRMESAEKHRNSHHFTPSALISPRETQKRVSTESEHDSSTSPTAIAAQFQAFQLILTPSRRRPGWFRIPATL